jgi:hypothetical protein
VAKGFLREISPVFQTDSRFKVIAKTILGALHSEFTARPADTRFSSFSAYSHHE